MLSIDLTTRYRDRTYRIVFPLLERIDTAVASSVCLSVTSVNRAKTDEPIKMLLGVQTVYYWACVGGLNYSVGGSSDAAFCRQYFSSLF